MRESVILSYPVTAITVAASIVVLFFIGRQTAFREAKLEQDMTSTFVDVYKQKFRVPPCEHENMPARERCADIKKAFMDGQILTSRYAHTEEIAAYAKLGAETRRSLKTRSQ